VAEYAVAIRTQAGEEYAVISDHGLTSTELDGDVLRPRSATSARLLATPVTVKLDFTIEHCRSLQPSTCCRPRTIAYGTTTSGGLGVHSAWLNATVELKELETVGYQPLALRIVSAKPDHLTHPDIVNEVPSIQARVVDENRSFCTLLASPPALCRMVLHGLGRLSGTST